jgi:cell division protein ZapE
MTGRFTMNRSIIFCASCFAIESAANITKANTDIALMSLIDLYQAAIKQPDMVHDKAQQQAIDKLEALSQRLLHEDGRTLLNTIRKLAAFRSIQLEPVRGMYLWGGVGRGKSWLMNMFYENLAIEEKKRIHFHRFMHDIHDRLSSFNDKKQKEPLQLIARELSSKYRLLCIDEFIVTNITDAMILSELLHALFRHQVCLVATSNRVPDDLYLNGLQRERFLPAIELIKKHTEVFHLDGGIDHRTSLLEQSDVYYYPASEAVHQQVRQRMQELAITPVQENRIIRVLKRDIQTLYCSDDIAWFDFDVICSAPRAARDYIELAQRFNTVIVSNIPVMDEYSDDQARRFIYLIDELYDRNVKLIASAVDAPQHLYHGDMLKFAFNRTSSRLVEMRSHQYLSRSHKPFR